RFTGEVLRRGFALARALLTFAVLSSVTALVVRMLLSSGVAAMFPFFALLRRMGFTDLDDRVLAASYPWIGRPMQALRRQNKPTGPFIMAHLVQVVVYYTLYNAVQVAWTMWLYDKSAQLEMSLFGMMLLWEYYCLVFVRSAAGIAFFPRVTMLYFTAYHMYFFMNPMGYFGLAALSTFLLVLHAMLYTVTDLEVPALTRGEISAEHPRACFVELPWPSWGASLPPTWTLFLPTNTRVRGVYENIRPSRPVKSARSAVSAITNQEGGKQQ
ncbi:hypothetical protein JKP88DRAFT_326354, partial [Tribonema minus]